MEDIYFQIVQTEIHIIVRDITNCTKLLPYEFCNP